MKRIKKNAGDLRFDGTKLYDVIIKEHQGTRILYKNSLQGSILNRWVKSWVQE